MKKIKQYHDDLNKAREDIKNIIMKNTETASQ